MSEKPGVDRGEIFGDISNNIENQDQVRIFYFTILEYQKGITQKNGESDEMFAKRQVRREEQFQRAVQGIKEMLGVDPTSADGLKKVKEVVGDWFAKRSRKAGSVHDLRRARKALADMVGVPLATEDEGLGPIHPAVHEVGLVNLAARGDVAASIELMRLRYDLNQEEVGFIRLIADCNKITPLIESIINDKTDATQAKNKLKNIYSITGSKNDLEKILTEKTMAAMHAEEELEKVFGIAGVDELLKQIEQF